MPLKLLATLLFFQFTLAGFATGVTSGSLQPVQEKGGTSRRIEIHLTNPDELKAMQRISPGTKPVPEHQAAVQQYLQQRTDRTDNCLATQIGTVPGGTIGNQSCDFEVWRVECNNGAKADVTVSECTALSH